MMASVAPFAVLDQTLDYKKPEDGALQLLAQLRPDWNLDQVTFERMSGGHANCMLCAFQATDTKKSDAIVVRVWNTAYSKIIGRTKEFLAMQISHAAGCFPEILATYKNGVMYRYVHGRTLTMQDVLNPDVIRLISRKIAQFHHIDVDSLSLFDVTGEKATCDKTVDYFEKNKGFLAKLPSEVDIDDTRSQSYQQHKMSAESLAAELQAMQSVVESMDMTPCLIHGDFHFYNIVYDPEQGDVTFVDYEVARYRYGCMDLNQLFGQRGMIEDLGRISADDPEFTEDARAQYLRHYLERWFELEGKDPTTITDADFQLLDMEHKLLYPMFLLYWIIIGHMLANSKDMQLDLFSYVPRFKRDYFALKEELPALLTVYQAMKTKK